MTFAFAMCGPCAAEGLLLARAAARAKGFGGKNGDVGSPYHLQSTLWFLASAIVGGTWCLILPDDTWAFLLYSILIASFFMLSLMNHAWQAIVHGNRTWQNLSRAKRPLCSHHRIRYVDGSRPLHRSESPFSIRHHALLRHSDRRFDPGHRRDDHAGRRPVGRCG